MGNNVNTNKHPRDRQNADIVICKKCGHEQMYPLLTPEEEREEYDQDKTIRFGGISGGTSFEEQRIKFHEWTKQHIDIYYDQLQEFENVLEIGAGYGFFMEACNLKKDRKFNIEGIEIGEFRRAHFVGGIVHNVNVLSEEIPEDLLHKFDCVICMHVLEHIGEPIKFLRKIQNFLKPKGTVIFEVPNSNCLLREMSKEYSDFWYLYEHCSYYTSDTLKLVFEKAGYFVSNIYSREIYSIENHCRWIREGVPFTKYNQMFISDERLEWINELYKEKIGKDGRGYSLIIEANIQ